MGWWIHPRIPHMVAVAAGRERVRVGVDAKAICGVKRRAREF